MSINLTRCIDRYVCVFVRKVIWRWNKWLFRLTIIFILFAERFLEKMHFIYVLDVIISYNTWSTSKKTIIIQINSMQANSEDHFKHSIVISKWRYQWSGNFIRLRNESKSIESRNVIHIEEPGQRHIRRKRSIFWYRFDQQRLSFYFQL